MTAPDRNRLDNYDDRASEQLQLEGFAIGRVQNAGRALGLMEAALDSALTYSRGRSVVGRIEYDVQLVQAKLGAMAVKLHAARR